MFIPHWFIGAWLCLLSLTTAITSPTIPASIEIDALWPIGSVAPNLFPSFPIIFAFQNAPAAYHFEWVFEYRIYNASDYASAQESGTDLWTLRRGEPYNWESGFNPASHFEGPTEFHWYFDSDGVAVAVVPAYLIAADELTEGDYVILWQYNTENCYEERERELVVAGGVHPFSIQEGGKGFEVLLDGNEDECPVYSGGWTVEDTRDDGCPFMLSEEIEDPRPCRGRLRSREQVQCLVDFFEGARDGEGNETVACREGFQRAMWPGAVDSFDFLGMYDDDGHAIGEDGGRQDEGDEDAAVSYKPVLYSLLVSLTLVLGVNL